MKLERDELVRILAEALAKALRDELTAIIKDELEVAIREIFDAVEKRLDRIEERLDDMERRLDRVEYRSYRLHSEMSLRHYIPTSYRAAKNSAVIFDDEEELCPIVRYGLGR
jgi:hypothetical protein